MIRPWYVPLLILRVHFYRQERAQWWFPKALKCALGKRSLVHYVQRARKVGWGGVQLIRWEGGGWAADNSMAISQAGSVQLIDPPNCIPHCLTVSLPHILSCTSPIPSSWQHIFRLSYLPMLVRHILRILPQKSVVSSLIECPAHWLLLINGCHPEQKVHQQPTKWYVGGVHSSTP